MLLCLNMIFKLIYLVHISSVCFAFLTYDPAVRESDVEGLVGETVRLPCEVDKENCGVFHNIKWYKGNERVFIFSENPDVKRPEGSLLQRGDFHYSEDSSEDWLEISPLMVKDEGKYKCELTYLTVKESCSVVQFVNLKTLARPTSFELSFEDGSPIDNGTKIGPFLEGDDLFLQCQAGGAKPVPSVLWKNGSNKMQGRFHSKIDTEGLFIGTNSIQMTLGRQDLTKNLVCHVNNAAMPSPVTLSVRLDVDVSPYEVAIQTHKQAFKEGDNVELLCIARGAKPPATITWKNGSTPLLEARTKENIHEEDSEIAHPDGTFETRSLLRFPASKFDNLQQFSCEAMNSALRRQGRSPMLDSISLDVQFAPTVQVHPQNLTLNESADFLIHCEYSANPVELTYAHWYIDGHQLDVSNPEKYRNGNIDHPSLFVLNSTADDMGEYTCRVGNSIGVSNVTNSAYVSVQYPPIVAVEIDPQGPVSEEMRPNVTLTCEIMTAHPHVLTKVRWFLHGELLKELPECDDGNVTLDYESLCDVTPSRLALENIFRQFHGNYSCQGMNDAGWGPVSLPAPLVVNYAPGNAVLTYSPQIVIKGEQVNFTCETDDIGRPAAETYIWTRNSHKVRNVTSKHWIIDSASLETEANFTCLPYNSEGNGSLASVAIDVLGTPTFIDRLPTYHGALINAEEVALTCRVECSPICEVTWYKDNLPLYNETHYEVSSIVQPSNPATGDLESVLSTLSWKMARWPDRMLHREVDNANFTCASTSNRAGPGVSSHTIFRVEYPPENVYISTQSVEVVEGNTPERISCHASSYPEPNYYWLHNEETVATGAVLDLSFEIKKEHSGDYICVAENKHGSVTAEAFVDVLFKPECKINRQDSSSRDTSQILLICRTIANPENVSFRWRVGNETLIDNVLSVELESRLYLEGSTASLGTYYCYVNNSVGESIPCEIDVTGLVETLGDESFLLYVFISLAVIIVIIAVIILLICCMRQRQRGKYAEDSTLHKENPDSITKRSTLQPQISPTKVQPSLLQPSHKWPHRPGVQVHINSLTNLADDSKPLYSNNPPLNTNTNSTTISSSSYQLQHHNQLDNAMSANLNQVGHKRRVNNAATVDTRRTSSTAPSAVNILSSKISAMQTLPPPRNRPDPPPSRVPRQPRHEPYPLPPNSHKTNLVQRPKSFVTDFTSIYNADTDSAKNDNAPEQKSNSNPNETNPTIPEAENPKFYENLPFHGIQAPPNKVTKSEVKISVPVCRPSSQLSHPSSSGYCSSRSSSCLRHSQHKVLSPAISSPKQGNSSLAGSLTFIRTPSIKKAKEAIVRTAALLSFRNPLKLNSSNIIKESLQNSSTDESGAYSMEAEDGVVRLPVTAEDQTPFSQSEYTDALATENPALTITSTHTPNSMVAPVTTDPTTFEGISSHLAVTADFNSLGIPVPATNNATIGPSSLNFAIPFETVSPKPAPRVNTKMKHPYQNIPLTKDNISSSSHSFSLSVPSACFENRRKYLCDPLDTRHNQPPVTGNSSSSNSSTPSSHYQHPYHSSYSSTYNSDSPPTNFVQYPPSYPSQPKLTSMYMPSSNISQSAVAPGTFPSFGTNPGRSHGAGHEPSTGVYSNSSYSNSDLPYRYKKSYPNDPSSLQFNGPVIGQEIDV